MKLLTNYKSSTRANDIGIADFVERSQLADCRAVLLGKAGQRRAFGDGDRGSGNNAIGITNGIIAARVSCWAARWRCLNGVYT